MEIRLLIEIGLVCGVALWGVMFGLRTLTSLTAPRLRDQHPPMPAEWPTLSVVIPARDEAETLPAALASLRAQSYPNWEIVLVNDRSTDGTGALIDQLADEDVRIVAVHIEHLPEGWLGKVHAMEQGLQRATGSLVLFADADTHYAPDTLKKAVALTQAHQLVHLTLIPHLDVTGPLQGALMAAFFDGYLERFLGKKSFVLPQRGAVFGFGAFNLVRRHALEQTAGLRWLAMDIADDLALALLLRGMGPTGCCVANDELSLTFYPSLRQAIRGWEKNAFPIVAQFSVPRAVLLLIVMSLLVVTTLAAATLLPAQATSWLFGGIGVLWVSNALSGRLRLGRTFSGALLEPVAFVIMIFALARSTYLIVRNQGVMWRDTFYPLAALKAGQRARFL